MKTGDRITIHAGSTSAEGTIMCLSNTDDLPSIPGAPDVEEVRAVLKDGTFTRIALIDYKFLDTTMAFIALEDTRGRWWDLKGKELLIEPHTFENAARSLALERAIEKMRRETAYPD